ncbi:MAG: hypothetical protein IID33_02110, partial [Planctomycetes bacterium]|nr:hypothetical protein [Planctomycetota bacterium]
MYLRKLGLVVICAATAIVTADDLSTLRQNFLNENAGARLMNEGPRITRVYGAAFGFGNSAEETADQFRIDYAEMFGVSPDSLRPGNAANGQLAQPVMYDPQTDSYKFTLVYYRQFFGAIPVYRSSMLVLVRNEPGFPLVWVNPYVRDLGDFQINAAAAALQAADYADLAQAEVGELNNFTAPRAVIWAGVDDMVVEPRLAVEIIGDNGNPIDQDPQKRLFIMDAATGEVLHTENLILTFSEVSGTVRGMATVGPGADVCGPEDVFPLPYARVSVGGTVVFADVNGCY